MFNRLFELLLTLFFAIFLVFWIVRLVPGDPAQLMLGEKGNAESIEKLRKELGFDQPITTQFGIYLRKLAQGDLGASSRSGQNVMSEIGSRLPATIELSLAAIFIATVLGLILGVLAAIRPGGFVDTFLSGLAVVGMSIPIFFLGLLVTLVFGVWLGWFPLSGRISYEVSYEPITGIMILDGILTGNGDLIRAALHYLVLPAFTLATIPTSLIARLTRTSLIQTSRADYIRTARAKGVSEYRIFLVHALRNALLPVLTMTGFQFGVLLGGAILTENVFAWPGIGRWIVSSVEGRDYPAIQGAILTFAFLIVFTMAATDFVLRWVDPRLRVKS